MSSRKPAVSTQLKNAQAEIAELKKQLESSKSSQSYYNERANKLQAEVEEIHSFFDALPNVISRKADDGYTQRAAMTRMAAWLASK